jgi:hypothetical protein
MAEFAEFYSQRRDDITSSVVDVVQDIGRPTPDDVMFEVLTTSHLVAECIEEQEDGAKYRPVIIALLKRIHAMVEFAYNLKADHVKEIWMDVLRAEQAIAKPDLRETLLMLRQAQRLIDKVSQNCADDFDTLNALGPLLRTFNKRLVLHRRITLPRWNELQAINYALACAARREELDLDSEPLSEHFRVLVVAMQNSRMRVKTLSEHVGKLLGTIFQHVN